LIDGDAREEPGAIAAQVGEPSRDARSATETTMTAAVNAVYGRGLSAASGALQSSYAGMLWFEVLSQ
jgi:hypothetical protein